MLYNSYGPLTAAQGKTRIYAPIAYTVVRNARAVPIVHIESFSMAAWFPICWKAAQPQPILIVLRTLWEDGSHQPAGSPAVPASLPLALRAYPFVVNAGDGNGPDTQILVEEAIPDQPSDVGATILTPDGKPGRGTEMKLRAASAFRSALPLTEEMSDELSRGNLFEPWPLRAECDGTTKTVEDMLVVRPSEFQSAKIFRFIQKFGPAGATLLGAHRISLFRAGNLFQAAKSAAGSHT